jgi:hypothetical protein
VGVGNGGDDGQPETGPAADDGHTGVCARFGGEKPPEGWNRVGTSYAGTAGPVFETVRSAWPSVVRVAIVTMLRSGRL